MNPLRRCVYNIELNHSSCMNVSWLPFVGYSLPLITYLSHVSETAKRDTLYFGTLLLVVGHTLLAFAFAKDFLSAPEKPLKEQQLKITRLKQIGFTTITVFLIFSLIGWTGIHVRAYDYLGVIGYGLLSMAHSLGVYFVMLYLAFSIFFKWNLLDPRENLHVLGKSCVLAFYILIILF